MMDADVITRDQGSKPGHHSTVPSGPELTPSHGPSGEDEYMPPRHDMGATTTGSVASAIQTGNQSPIRSSEYGSVQPETDFRNVWRQAAIGLARIQVQPGAQRGRPTIRDTRISVEQIVDLVRDLGNIAAVTEQFDPTLSAEDVKEALQFAARLAR